MRVLPIAVLGCVPLLSHAAGYTQVNLSADVPGVAAFTDANLQNPWGLSVPPKRSDIEAYWWAADNLTGVSTLYGPDGSAPNLVVTIPSADGASIGSPTGTVDFNKNFVFVTEDGTISVWYYNQYWWSKPPSAATITAAHKPKTDARAITDSNTNCMACHVNYAVLKVKTPGAAYEGVTVSPVNGADALLVANVNRPTLEAYDANFQPVSLAAAAFADPQLPAGFTATNVQTAGGLVWVVYVSDAGGGYVVGYNPDGTLKVRLEQGALDDPWGVAVAPRNFGTYSNAVLIGNVGSGKIAAFNIRSGRFLGYLTGADGNDIADPGLWAIAFGKANRNNGPTNVLYFNAGTDGQMHGLFGSISAN
jgi:uncharacterized protein (TIGR03118 family)